MAKARPTSTRAPARIATLRRPSGTAGGICQPDISTSGTPRRNHWERRLQIFLVRRFRSLVDPIDASLIALENGEGRAAETIELLKAMGLEDGLPDLMLLGQRRRIRFIEVKLEATLRHARTELRGEQTAFHDLLGFYGFQVDVVRSWAEFWAIVEAEGIPHRDPGGANEQLLLWSVERRKRPAVETG